MCFNLLSQTATKILIFCLFLGCGKTQSNTNNKQLNDLDTKNIQQVVEQILSNITNQDDLFRDYTVVIDQNTVRVNNHLTLRITEADGDFKTHQVNLNNLHLPTHINSHEIENNSEATWQKYADDKKMGLAILTLKDINIKGDVSQANVGTQWISHKSSTKIHMTGGGEEWVFSKNDTHWKFDETVASWLY